MILRDIFGGFKRSGGGGQRGRRGPSTKFPAMPEQLERRVLFASVAFASPVITQISSGVFPVTATAIGDDLNGDGVPGSGRRSR